MRTSFPTDSQKRLFVVYDVTFVYLFMDFIIKCKCPLKYISISRSCSIKSIVTFQLNQSILHKSDILICGQKCFSPQTHWGLSEAVTDKKDLYLVDILCVTIYICVLNVFYYAVVVVFTEKSGQQ